MHLFSLLETDACKLMIVKYTKFIFPLDKGLNMVYNKFRWCKPFLYYTERLGDGYGKKT